MNLKPSFDRALTEGMNRLVWHEFTSSPPELSASPARNTSPEPTSTLT